MSKIRKFNEFINNNQLLIEDLIKKAEHTNLSNLEAISKRESYVKLVEFGEEIIPYLLERNNIIWDIALSKITGCGLNPLDFNTSKRSEYWKKWAIENGYKK